MVSAVGYIGAVTARLDDAEEDFAMLPTLLARACVDVFAIQGAGLSVLSDLRLPLGASDSNAALVEQLQVTLGAGPCLAASDRAEVLVADEEMIAATWPVFHAELRQRTPYRSVMALPLVLGGYVGALDLYSTESSTAAFPSPDELWTSVGQPITELMSDVPTVVDRIGLDLPSWLVTDRVDARLNVWMAVGMVLQQHAVSSSDALALLRGHAYSQSRQLEQVSDDLIERRLTVADVVGPR